MTEATINKFEKGVGSLKNIGQYYVSESCIDCDLCRQMAPNTFKRAFTGCSGRSIVAAQPATPREQTLAAEAMDACPVGAIAKTA